MDLKKFDEVIVKGSPIFIGKDLEQDDKIYFLKKDEAFITLLVDGKGLALIYIDIYRVKKDQVKIYRKAQRYCLSCRSGEHMIFTKKEENQTHFKCLNCNSDFVETHG